MKTKRVIRTGKAGTKRLQKLYGDQLICVRYKYDYTRNRKYKTIELIVEDKEWAPKDNDPYLKKVRKFKLYFNEVNLRQKVIACGGIWNNTGKYWELDLRNIIKLNLEKRIVD